jgi:phenylacetate 2-hydroxylase/3-hydroxyphenylacetate 6-hydroxylase
MCVASHIASRALYTVILHLVTHFQILPAQETSDPTAWDPLEGLLSKGNHQAAPAATKVKLVPRHLEATKRMLSQAQ